MLIERAQGILLTDEIIRIHNVVELQCGGRAVGPRRTQPKLNKSTDVRTHVREREGKRCFLDHFALRFTGISESMELESFWNYPDGAERLFHDTQQYGLCAACNLDGVALRVLNCSHF